MARELGCNPKTINSVLERLGLTYAGNQGSKGLSKPNGRDLSLVEYLAKSIDIQSNKVRKKLLAEGYKEHCCECCGLTEWLNEPIPLELHHINGVKDDLRIENLAILCPNCHSFTDNYRGKNIGMSAQEETLDVEAG